MDGPRRRSANEFTGICILHPKEAARRYILCPRCEIKRAPKRRRDDGQRQDCRTSVRSGIEADFFFVGRFSVMLRIFTGTNPWSVSKATMWYLPVGGKLSPCNSEPAECHDTCTFDERAVRIGCGRERSVIGGIDGAAQNQRFVMRCRRNCATRESRDADQESSDKFRAHHLWTS